MFKTIKDAFFITKNKIILLQPLIIFLLILTFAVLPLKPLANNPLAFYAVFINLMLLSIAFGCGWFGMIKKAVLSFDFSSPSKHGSREELNLFKEFFPAVGDYFLSLCAASILFVIISTGFSILIFKIGTHIFSNTDLLVQMFNQSMMPLDKQKEFLASLSQAQLFVLNKYIFYFAFWYFLFNLLFMFYPAIIFLETKNPFKALFKSVCFVFKKPLLVIGIYFYLMITGFAVSALGILGNINLILSLITLFITLLYISNYIVVIFLSYEKHCNCDNGSDCER